MKALTYHGPGRRLWGEVPDPVLTDPEDAIVRVEAVTVCGTDLHILKGDVPEVTDGRILGHEAVGTVVDTGTGVRTTAAGDRVGPGDTVVVVGAGPIGHATIATARPYTPARIIAVDLAHRPGDRDRPPHPAGHDRWGNRASGTRGRSPAMRHRQVADVMTREVVRVPPGAGFREIAATLAVHRISAVPVVDEAERPIGIVSEADLMHTQAVQDDPDEMRTVPRPEGDRTTAAGLMSAPPVCIAADASVVAAARHMERNSVKHLPVVDADGRLVGMVSRADLVKVFLRDDRAIAEQIVGEVLGEIDGADPAAVSLDVDQGRVTLSGVIDPPYLAAVVCRLCRAIDGVVSVTDRTRRAAEVTTFE
ncbi:CBS domain-containing protein [Kitasatospora sp. NPDC085879]|uniref:CBS domain-containing protein n=1 Tax=Kitasatospora sp. NPDC085879 TaxID=3154769 RepID=UPI00343EFC67